MNAQPWDHIFKSPFCLIDDQYYKPWRDAKLAAYPKSLDEVMVQIANPEQLTQAEKAELKLNLERCNMAIYQFEDNQAQNRETLRDFSASLGLVNLDTHLCTDGNGVTALHCDAQSDRNFYIPYTDRAINWHTDGYYNPEQQMIRGMLLHCDNPSNAGGESFLLDPEIVYIRLRDENPDLIAALMQKDAFSIPPNEKGTPELNKWRPNPVFVLDRSSADLYMRFSARKRNIQWKDDPTTQLARQKILEILEHESLIMRGRLEAGMGLLCNNVLHGRKAFNDTDDCSRLMYRVRSFDRVSL